jgi:DNA-binding LacI/PurR family transcriptional regulator
VSETARRSRRNGPTIADVARHAGVSTMTVSNVLNARSQRVGDATRDRVLASLSELGYRVNLAARQLRTGRTGTIGLGIPDFRPGYYSWLANRLANRLAQHDLRLVLERTTGRHSELATLTTSRLSAYDGFVLSVVAGDINDLEQLNVDTPVVLIGERTVPARFDHVLMDNVGGARMATELLLERGATRIAILGGIVGPKDSMPELRTRGYLDAHKAAGAKVIRDLIRPSSFSVADGYEQIQVLLEAKTPFDAVFALTDSLAIGALNALNAAGLRVPEDVQLIGFDNLAEGQYCHPRLSTIEPGNTEMVDAITELLISRIAEGSERRSAKLVMPAARVVERGSTRPIP